MKKISLLTLVVSLLLFLSLSGCRSGNFQGGRLFTGPAAADIVNYVNQDLLGIAELERRSLEAYASVTGENYTSDRKVYDELKDFIVPNYKRFLDSLKNISSKNEEVRGLHGIYVNGAESMYNGFLAKMAGIENSNETVIVQGNRQIEEGKREIERWRLELSALYEKHGVAEMKNEDASK